MITYILPVTNLLLIITISAVALHNFAHLSKHRSAKSKLINEASDLYPYVKPEFYSKPIVEQTVENNHEIHELNKRVERLEDLMERFIGGQDEL